MAEYNLSTGLQAFSRMVNAVLRAKSPDATVSVLPTIMAWSQLAAAQATTPESNPPADQAVTRMMARLSTPSNNNLKPISSSEIFKVAQIAIKPSDTTISMTSFQHSKSTSITTPKNTESDTSEPSNTLKPKPRSR
jgi:hypothetical protein